MNTTSKTVSADRPAQPAPVTCLQGAIQRRLNQPPWLLAQVSYDGRTIELSARCRRDGRIAYGPAGLPEPVRRWAAHTLGRAAGLPAGAGAR